MKNNLTMVITISLVVGLFLGVVLVNLLTYDGETMLKAGFCYGKEGKQLLPYAEISNTYFEGDYDKNLTKYINCDNIRSDT